MIPIAFALAFVSVFLPILRAYALNAQYIQIGTTSIVALAMISVGFVGGCAWLAMRLTWGRFRSLVSLIFLYLAIMAWFFLNFFPSVPGYMDGQLLNFEEFRLRFGIEIWFTLAIALSIYAFRSGVMRHVTIISSVICLWSMAGTAPTLLKMLHSHETTFSSNSYIDNSDSRLVHFSSSNNVILFILDTFQSDVAKRVLLQDPLLRQEFSDFNFHQNTASEFSKTYLSVPTILTGKTFDNSETIQKFLNSAYFQSGSVPYRTQAAGFDTRAYVYVNPPQLPDPLLWDNIYDPAFNDLATIVRMAIFSISPIAIKSLLADDLLYEHVLFTILKTFSFGKDHSCSANTPNVSLSNNFAITEGRDMRLFGRLINCSAVRFEQPVFRLFHMQGAHKPYFLSNANDEPLANTAYAQYETQVRGTLHLMASVINQLKNINVYRGATIVIVSDHGAQEYLREFDRSTYDGYENEIGEPSDHIISAALATLMIKHSNQNQKRIQFSNEPVSTKDVSPTLLAAAGLSTNQPTISDLRGIPDRIRHHSFYRFHGWDFTYVRGLKRYQIHGPVWDASSWSPGRILSPKQESLAAGTAE